MESAERAVERLTTTHAVFVGEAVGECGPLLTELWEARYPNLGRTKGGGGNGDVLDMKAVTMYETIDAGVRAWLEHFRQPHKGDLIELTRNLHGILRAEHAGDRLEDPDRMFAMFETWVQRIEEMFDPPREYELTAACPICETEHAIGEEGAQRWAVRVPVKEGRALVAECHECGAMWGGQDQLTQLAEGMGLEIDWVALREFMEPREGITAM